jgi:cutinase
VRRILLTITALVLGLVAAGTTTDASAAPGQHVVLQRHSAAASAPAAVAATTSASSCNDVTVIGARGSGQLQAGTSADAFSGLGPQIYGVFSQLKSDLGSRRTVGYRAVVYPASSVTKLVQPSVYFNGLSQGVSWTQKELAARAKACPSERLVLTGYSQGAMVMHRVLDALIASGDTSTLQRIDGAVLVADGDRVPKDRTVLKGTASPSATGVGLEYSSFSHSSRKLLPANVGARVFSVCNVHDPVCNSSGTAADFVWFNIHTGYKSTGPVLSSADAVAATVLTTPVPVPRTTVVSGTVGSALSRQLIADVDPAYQLEWSVSPTSALPPGIMMSPTGLLTGTSSSPITSTTAVRVRGVLLGVSTSWVTAVVQWSISTPPPPPVSTLPIATIVGTTGAAGPAGTIFRIQTGNTLCPAPQAGNVGGLEAATSMLGGFTMTDFTSSGDTATAPYPGEVDLPTSFSAPYESAAPGTYTISLRCVTAANYNSYSPHTGTQSFQPLTVTVSGPPLGLQLAQTTVAPGATLQLTPQAPCPFPAGYVESEADDPAGVQFIDPTGFYGFPTNVTQQQVGVDPSGNWSASIRLPAVTAPGTYSVIADCGNYDYRPVAFTVR